VQLFWIILRFRFYLFIYCICSHFSNDDDCCLSEITLSNPPSFFSSSSLTSNLSSTSKKSNGFNSNTSISPYSNNTFISSFQPTPIWRMFVYGGAKLNECLYLL
jgi:hypothetical protein